jgi:hypothetical protein
MFLIVDGRISEKCERKLNIYGFTLIKLPADPDLGVAIRSHPDTVLFCCDGEIITTADYCESAAYVFSDIREYSPNTKIHFTSERRSDKYPKDCIMNALVIGKRIFCKSDSISEGIIEFANRKGYEIVHTNQGYPACSVLSFGNNAITADTGLALTLEKNGVNVTLISNGGISLPPYDYGFIGGASGVIGKKVFFFGDISKHPDCKKICSAIENAGYTPVSLSDEELTDLGGIIAI